jgi:hypothetical protein
MIQKTTLPSQASSGAPLATAIDKQAELERIRIDAVHLAEKRGFEPGHENEDWAKA